MVNPSCKFLYGPWIHLMSSLRCKTIGLDMMVQKRSYRSEDEEKTDRSQIISESTQGKAIYKLTPEMTGRSGLCTEQAMRGNTKRYNFPSAERCVGKMKIVMQGVFQGWKVVPPYLPHVHPRANRKQRLLRAATSH